MKTVYVPELTRDVEYSVDIQKVPGDYDKYVVTVPEFDTEGTTNQNDKVEGLALSLIRGATGP